MPLIPLAPQQRADFIVITQKAHVKGIRTILKDKSQVEISAAFKEIAGEFANAQTAVDMGTTEGFAEVTKRLKTLYALIFWQGCQSLEHVRVKSERFFQVVP
jgi:hypothetical protein